MVKNILSIVPALAGLVLSLTLGACSGDEPVAEVPHEGTHGKVSVTMRLGGISGNGGSRASDYTPTPGDTTMVDLTAYTVKCYVFKTADAGDNFNMRLYRELNVTESMVTIEDLEPEKYHTFIFLACKKEFKDCLDLKRYEDKEKNKEVVFLQKLNGNTWQDAGTEGTEFKYCYLSVFDEPEMSSTADYTFADTEFRVRTVTVDGKEESFLLYADAITFRLPSWDNYMTPDYIYLRPQFGKVQFNLGDGKAISEARVYSNYFRFYLSQVAGIKGDAQNTSEHPTLENAMTTAKSAIEITSGSKTYKFTGKNNYLGNYVNGNVCRIVYSPIAGGNSFYLPCTTLDPDMDLSDLKTNNCANTAGEKGASPANSFTVWAYRPISSTSGISSSVKIGNNTYSTSSAFPIFRRRTTILKVKGDDEISISFSGSGLNLDNDEWDGIK